MAKRVYEVVFWITKENSGEATFLATSNGGRTPPYQRPVDEDNCEQTFTFKNLSDLFAFLESAFKKFKQGFSVRSINLYNYPLA